MAGDLQIHPLTKTYDEVRRAKLRLEKHLRLSTGQLTEESYQLYRRIIDLSHDLLAEIPDEYHLKPYEIVKEHEKLRGE